MQWILKEELGSGKETIYNQAIVWPSICVSPLIFLLPTILASNILKYKHEIFWIRQHRCRGTVTAAHPSVQNPGPCKKELQVCCFPGATVLPSLFQHHSPSGLGWEVPSSSQSQPSSHRISSPAAELAASSHEHIFFSHLLQEQGHWKGYLLTALGQMSKKENKSIYKSAKEKTCDSNGLLCNSLSVAWSCLGIISCDAESAEQPHLCID